VYNRSGPDLIKLGPSAQFFLGPSSQKNVLEKFYIEMGGNVNNKKKYLYVKSFKYQNTLK
jgi:hypothetical protein